MPFWRMSFAAAHLEVYADCSSNPEDAVHKSHLGHGLGYITPNKHCSGKNKEFRPQNYLGTWSS
jgi:hypothetical protein